MDMSRLPSLEIHLLKGNQFLFRTRESALVVADIDLYNLGSSPLSDIRHGKRDLDRTIGS